ncbi:PTS system N-acetylglucosamine-specific IIC component, Glc family; PTS system N-acetylglucosamine-specific IIB component, Glc family [Thermaerobacter marianensis DSM 12885]|uniref:PTS system N-acetylglucosamine-specific IIC component, Glc family PTS system N-acetylglucosamine-specific IIB component, Glc family n=1 Tax=Thermaerobacter marianensis (strain ATCC 700841 / DSM 12885 / JCM 10246 / 7p75a) TaxID=644966 RepID=E6SHL0_THEM7|nr:PTS transporter subunit EIIC [Thermaerobacter marianensis]ADU51805.1 PTS system N-acetylglucosamine-specific IIC component, Glc family; PTS system N-acetylglucosamine-specific IIB component, Glc family [Thermaerobacter marianensis DSM 12885]
MNVMGGLQRIGRALMAPVAVLPAAGILLRLGQPDLLNIPVMAQAGDAIFSNLPLLFAIGVGIGLANQAGVAGLAALVGYVVFQKTLTTINQDLNMGVLAGILTGALAAAMYNRYHGIRLPEWLGFFGGRRFVPLVTAFWALVLGVVFGFVWGPVQGLIDALGNWIVGAGAVGVFVFGVLNRLLLPFGLHHIINSLVWFVFGDYTNPTTGEVVHGDLHRFFAGDKTAGIFMAGWYPIMMFGLVGVALAMIHEAKPENRASARGILLSAALTSFVTGITEPLEFAFMFLTPVLYVTHALLSGISMALVYELGIRHGFTFSAGLIDFVLNWGIATRPALLIPIGLVFMAVYYVLFRFLIRRLDLPTPGREPAEAQANPGA